MFLIKRIYPFEQCIVNCRPIHAAVHFAIAFLAITSFATAQSNADNENVFDLDPFVVTGTKTIHRLSESPVRTELLTPIDLELAATRNFADAIELIPGVRVENNCQNCGTSEILLLGLEGKYSSLLFNGLPIYSGLASVYGLEQIPTNFIDRIEVVKGAGSSIYGSGAIGGVINIIGRDPVKSGGLFEYRHDSVKGQPSTQISALLDYVSENDKTRISVYQQNAKTDPVDLNNDGFSELTKRDLQVLGMRWTQNLEKGTLRASYDRTTEFRRGGDRFELPDNLANISERIDTSRESGSISWSSSISENLDYQASAGFAYTDRETFYGGLFGSPVDEPLLPESTLGEGDNDQAFLDRGYRTYGEVAQDEFGFTENWVYHLETQFDYRWSEHQTSFGLQYYYEKIDDIVPVSPFVTDFPILADIATGNSTGLYIQDDWHFSEGWELLLGIRGDKNSELDDVVFSPRASLRYEPSEELVLRGSIGTGFLAPQAFDEDLHIELIAGDRSTTRQANDLSQEDSYSALIGAVWNPAFAEGKLTIEANAFYTAIAGTFTNSEIRIDPITNENYRERFNGPDSEIGGVEFNIGSLPHENLRLDLGYVMQFARFKDPVSLFNDGAGNVVQEEDFLETPEHYGVFQATYTNNSFANIAFSAIYTGSMKDINQRTGILNEKTNTFLVFNIAFTRQFEFENFPNLTLSAGIKNITDDRQADIESGVDRDGYYLYGPRTPRTTYVSAKLRF